jgi:hypothetical protein
MIGFFLAPIYIILFLFCIQHIFNFLCHILYYTKIYQYLGLLRNVLSEIYDIVQY